MPSPSSSLPDSITQSIEISNAKSIGEQPAMLANLAYSNTVANTNISQQNAAANQQAMNELGVAVVGQSVDELSRSSAALGARSAVDVLTNNELAAEIEKLKAAIQAFTPKNA